MIDLSQYKSPDNEQSFFKNIPIQHLKEVQAHLGRNFKGMRYIFRGPRYDIQKVSTRKKDAHSFSVYKTYWYVL